MHSTKLPKENKDYLQTNSQTASPSLEQIKQGNEHLQSDYHQFWTTLTAGTPFVYNSSYQFRFEAVNGILMSRAARV